MIVVLMVTCFSQLLLDLLAMLFSWDAIHPQKSILEKGASKAIPMMGCYSGSV